MGLGTTVRGGGGVAFAQQSFRLGGNSVDLTPSMEFIILNNTIGIELVDALFTTLVSFCIQS